MKKDFGDKPLIECSDALQGQVGINFILYL